MIDNSQTYDRLLGGLRSARRNVWIAQLAFDVDCIAFPHGGQGPGALVRPGRAILETLLETAGGSEVDVCVLLNATRLLDTAKPFRRFLAAAGPGARRIRVRAIRRFPNLLHAKLVIVDDREAFLLGSPFVNGYWDDDRHAPADRRRPTRELGGRPLHDVSLRITGSAVRKLAAVFAELWNDVAGGTAAGDSVAVWRAPGSRPTPYRGVEVVRTAPRRTLSRRPRGRTEILDACLAGIGRARSLIYIEHQYLSARPVIAALAAALSRSPGLEVIIVLNQNPDVTAYRRWQNSRLADAALLDHPRVGVFALWSDGPRGAINQVFVHSKVLTVDDEWATVGTANLDGVSLHSYGDDFTTPLARRLFRHVRNFDVNVVITDHVRGAAGGGAVAELRTRLWGEHLGLSRDTLRRAPARGWLALWRRCASRNVAALNGHPSAPDRGGAGAQPANQASRMTGFVLPYSTQASPRRQLAAIGVAVDGRGLDVLFDPAWLEVHTSPGWLRNVVPWPAKR